MTLKKHWFDMIKSGYKKEEYREIKPYWESRLEGKTYDFIIFKNGYSPDAPTLKVQCLGIEKKNANPDWCGGDSSLYFAIKLGSIIS
ncbi:MAG: ASCH domain-containing protein [Chitinophagaceae bacterium]|nr:ASCH domain-containing protein [Chitinophagaceae bacterium]